MSTKIKYKESKVYPLGGSSIETPKIIVSEADRLKNAKLQREKERKKQEEQESQLRELAREQLSEFIKTPITGYENYQITDENKILIRVFKVSYLKTKDGRIESGLYVPEESFSEITCYAKVILSTDEKLNIGDIVTIPERLTGYKQNPDYIKLIQLHNERPKRNDLPPIESVNPMIHNLSQWSDFIFYKDKIETCDDDMLTFLISSKLITSKWLNKQ